MKRDIIIDKRIKEVRDSFISAKELIQRKYPNRRQEDIRITVFYKSIEVLDSVQMGRMHIAGNLTSLEWWNKHMTHTDVNTGRELPIPKAIIQSYVNKFDIFLKLGFLQFLFSSIESSFRTLANKIQDDIDGSESFWKIYTCILKTLSLEKHSNVFKFFSLIRNTIHNNGIYYPMRKRNEQIDYKEVTYNFIVGQKIDFVTWEFVLDFSTDLIQILLDIMDHKIIGSIDEIIDPASL